MYQFRCAFLAFAMTIGPLVGSSLLFDAVGNACPSVMDHQPHAPDSTIENPPAPTPRGRTAIGRARDLFGPPTPTPRRYAVCVVGGIRA